MMHRIAQAVVSLLSVIVLLAIPSAVFAADGPPAVFYVYADMGDHTDLVQIDTETDTLTKVITWPIDWRDGRPIVKWEKLPVTVEEFLPSVEWQAFQANLRHIPSEHYERIVDLMEVADINTRLEAIWEVDPNLLMFYRHFAKCYSITGPDTWCYGMTQFSLFDIQTQQERVIWTLPFHQEISDRGQPCFTDILYENFSGREPVDEVSIHPTRELVAVRFHSYGGEGCSDHLFLIDYSLEIPIVTEFPDIRSIAWSPDGTQLAYIEACRPYSDQSNQRACTNAYGIIDLTSMNIIFFEEAAVDNDSWIAWPTDNTLVFYTFERGDATSILVWYDIEDQLEQPFPLPIGQHIFTAFALRDEESVVVLGNGSNGLNSYPNLIFDDTPGIWSILTENIGWRSGLIGHSQYAVLVDPSREVGADILIDADLNRYPIDTLLAGYRDRYGAEAIRFAFVGAARP